MVSSPEIGVKLMRCVMIWGCVRTGFEEPLKNVPNTLFTSSIRVREEETVDKKTYGV